VHAVYRKSYAGHFSWRNINLHKAVKGEREVCRTYAACIPLYILLCHLRLLRVTTTSSNFWLSTYRLAIVNLRY
jgi:hypothetical protein